jgi:hypothetical protein
VLVAQQQVVGRDDMRAVVRAAAQLRGRLGEDRHPGGASESDEWLAQRRVELATGDDRTGSGALDVTRDLVEQEVGRRGVVRRHRGQRTLAATLQRPRLGRGHRPLDRQRRQRLAPGEVEVDRPGPRLPSRGRDRAAGGRAVVEQAAVVGVVRPDLAEPAHRRAVELDLVDRLAGADRAQLGRPVGGQQDQRDRRQVGLADGGVEVGSRGAGRAEDRHRRPARLGRAEREERRGALVDDHAHPDRRLAPERNRQRRRAGAWRDDRVAHPAAGQLLDEGRGERGVGVGRVHVWRVCHP